ncbi:hypothetical protein CRE_21934 [Caenorhabditis remanei]|uniref:Uncharacterized protein n=1 Tax=Caenorhabditis remanei TaxID=31234 RepID=E3MUF4_CAERE|nr:hypothetical protein CRE_21934 [Caenorhabditis remanei]
MNNGNSNSAMKPVLKKSTNPTVYPTTLPPRRNESEVMEMNNDNSGVVMKPELNKMNNGNANGAMNPKFNNMENESMKNENMNDKNWESTKEQQRKNTSYYCQHHDLSRFCTDSESSSAEEEELVPGTPRPPYNSNEVID